MTTIKKLTISPCASVLNQANKQINIEFKLDEENTQAILNQLDGKNLEELSDDIQTAAIYAVSKISKEELESKSITPYMRIGCDPRNKNIFFAFQIIADATKDKVLITKVEVYTKPEQSPIIEHKLSSAKIKVLIDENIDPIFVMFNLDEKSIEHLKEFETSSCTESEAEKISLEIPRAIGQEIYNKKQKTATLPEKFILSAQDPLSEDNLYKYRAVCQIINENNLEVVEIRIWQFVK